MPRGLEFVPMGPQVAFGGQKSLDVLELYRERGLLDPQSPWQYGKDLFSRTPTGTIQNKLYHAEPRALGVFFL